MQLLTTSKIELAYVNIRKKEKKGGAISQKQNQRTNEPSETAMLTV